MNQKLVDRFNELWMKSEKRMAVATCRYGHAAFVAWVFKIPKKNKPAEWWAAELNASQEVTNIKQICEY